MSYTDPNPEDEAKAEGQTPETGFPTSDPLPENPSGLTPATCGF